MEVFYNVITLKCLFFDIQRFCLDGRDLIFMEALKRYNLKLRIQTLSHKDWSFIVFTE